MCVCVHVHVSACVCLCECVCVCVCRSVNHEHTNMCACTNTHTHAYTLFVILHTGTHFLYGMFETVAGTKQWLHPADLLLKGHIIYNVKVSCVLSNIDLH